MTAVQLVGPADPDHYRVQVGRFGDRFYCDPLDGDGVWAPTDRTFPSVTVVKKASGEDWSNAARKRIAGRLQDPNERRRIDGLAPDDLLSTLQMWDQNGLDRAGKRGEDTHAYIAARLDGVTRPFMHPDSQAQDFIPAVESFLNAYRPTLVARAKEVVGINRSLNGIGYGGTFDAIIDIDGKQWLVDWKTRAEKHVIYALEGPQAGAYFGFDYMIVEHGGKAVREELPRLDGGLIVSLIPTGFKVFEIDLPEAFEHFTALHAWWIARRSETKCQLRAWAPVAVDPTPALTLVTDVPARSWTPERRERLRARVGDLVEHGGGPMLADALSVAEIPGLAHKGHTDEQLDRMLELVKHVEDEISAPFRAEDAPPPDDVVPAHGGLLVEFVHEIDEGPNVVPQQLTAMQAKIGQLDADQREHVKRIAAQANDLGVSFSISVLPSVRRFEIGRALIFLTEHAWINEAADWDAQLVRAVLVHATQRDDDGLPFGQVFGELTIDQARTAANTAASIASGSVKIVAMPGGGYELRGLT